LLAQDQPCTATTTTAAAATTACHFRTVAFVHLDCKAKIKFNFLQETE